MSLGGAIFHIGGRRIRFSPYVKRYIKVVTVKRKKEPKVLRIFPYSKRCIVEVFQDKQLAEDFAKSLAHKLGVEFRK